MIFKRAFIVLLWLLIIFVPLYWEKEETLSGAQEKEITVFTWSDIIAEEIIESFEKKTGIKVNLNFYPSNEDLITKLKATGGKGYDLIVPSDYAVKILKNADLIQPLDRSRIQTKFSISPKLQNHAFDVEGDYSIPFTWEVFGFVYDNTHFKKAPTSWENLFEPKGFKVAMSSDPVEAFTFAKRYAQFTKQSDVHALLKKQYPHVEAYTAMRGDYYVAMKNCQLAVVASDYAIRGNTLFPHLSFLIPDSYSFASIENLCIPKQTKKLDAIYAFITHIMSPENQALNANTYFFFPSNELAKPYLNEENQFFINQYKTATSVTQPLYFIDDPESEEAMRLFWIKLKEISP